jgi:NADH dehydrogenase [ubiquinone] 1 alpha subcomplex assembly factor 5
MVKSQNLFDRQLLQQNHKRYQRGFKDYNFLYTEIANIILENIELQNRAFDAVFEINKITNFFQENLQYKLFESCCFEELCDEENINFSSQKYDLIISNSDLHFINNVPQFLAKIKSALKPSGLFIASFYGDENLPELHKAIYQAENEIYGGISLRMPPTIDIKSSAQILAQVGFKNPVADLEKIKVDYDSPIKLLRDIKFSGQGNVMNQRSRKFFSKKLLQKLLEKYENFYDEKTQSYPATFSVITISGTANHF